MVAGARDSLLRYHSLLRTLNASSGLASHLREAVLIIGLCLIYAVASSLSRDGLGHLARENAEKLIAFENSFGFFWETAWNQWLAAAGSWLATAFNWVYILTFLAVIPASALAYYVAARDRYFHYRNVVIISLLFALFAHVVFPVAPPRMMAEYGFVDTMKSFGPGWYDVRDVTSYFNVYAAMPSIHFAWAVFFGVLFFRRGGRLLRVAGVLYPSITLAAIVATANHYLADAVAGALLMALAFWTHEAICRVVVIIRWRLFALQIFVKSPGRYSCLRARPHPPRLDSRSRLREGRLSRE